MPTAPPAPQHCSNSPDVSQHFTISTKKKAAKAAKSHLYPHKQIPLPCSPPPKPTMQIHTAAPHCPALGSWLRMPPAALTPSSSTPSTRTYLPTRCPHTLLHGLLPPSPPPTSRRAQAGRPSHGKVQTSRNKAPMHGCTVTRAADTARAVLSCCPTRCAATT